MIPKLNQDEAVNKCIFVQCSFFVLRIRGINNNFQDSDDSVVPTIHR